MLVLRVREGELESGGQWVYAWLAPDGVVYVGATALHLETRTWLHLHDDNPDVGRMRARFPEVANEELEVLAVELPEGVDRQRIRHGAVALLAERDLFSPRQVCDPPLDAEPAAETDHFVAAIENQLRRY
jgi:hypothetical protein